METVKEEPGDEQQNTDVLSHEECGTSDSENDKNSSNNTGSEKSNVESFGQPTDLGNRSEP
jgi:hypothetical protein